MLAPGGPNEGGIAQGVRTMCRNIRKLRQPDQVPTEQEVKEAALQFVRKVSGYRKPSRVNEKAFNDAVNDIAAVTRQLFVNLETR